MIIDFHNDTLLKLKLLGCSFFDDHPDVCCNWSKIHKTNIFGAFFSIWANPVFFDDGEQFLKKQVEQAKLLLESASHKTVICDQLALGIGSIGEYFRIFLNVEGGGVLNDSPMKTECLRSLNIRKLTLTHFQSTSWATCASDENTGIGLAMLGKEIVHALNQNGIVIDVAHSSTRTILDVVETSKSPVVYSHGGVRGINSNLRNISDDAIRAIASKGGVVGISFFPEHLTTVSGKKENADDLFWKSIACLKARNDLSPAKKGEEEIKKLLFEYPKPDIIPGLEYIYQHINYVVQLVGEDFVAIGSDFDGIPYTCSGLEDISKIYALVSLMKDAGYSDARVNKIMGGNIARIINEA